MAVWAFACKVEGSLNRWLDGEYEYLYPQEDTVDFSFLSNKGDALPLEDNRNTTFFKFVSQIRRGVGVKLIGQHTIGYSASKLNDFSDAVFMGEVVDIQLSRSILRFDETIYAVEYFGKTIELNNINPVLVQDGLFSLSNGLDAITAEETVLDEEYSNQLGKSVGDSFSFTDDFKLYTSGKAIKDTLLIQDSMEKEVEKLGGDVNYPGLIGESLVGALTIGGKATSGGEVSTLVEFVEEVQIVLT